MRDVATPQSGQAAVVEGALAVISTISVSVDTLSMANPAGIKDEEWRFRFMLLIPFANQSDTSSQRHQK
jgi:hypothetical protein